MLVIVSYILFCSMTTCGGCLLHDSFVGFANCGKCQSADFDTAFLEVSTYRFRHVVTGFFLFVIAKVKK